MGGKRRGGPGIGGQKAESVTVRQWEGKEERKILDFKILEMKLLGDDKVKGPVLNVGTYIGR